MQKRPSISHILILLVIALIACAEPTEFAADSAADCFDDEIFDAEAGVCYLACEEDNSCEANDFASFFSDLFANIGSGLSFYDGNAEPLIIYAIESDQLADAELFDASTDEEVAIQEDSNLHLNVWQTFSALIPVEERGVISEFGLFTDGVDETMAYVEPIPDSPTEWRIVVDTADMDNRRDFLYTLIHEFGHVLTLNNAQVPFDEVAYFSDDLDDAEDAMLSCQTFFTGEGCSRSDSYINAFFDQFWTEIYQENQAIDPDDSDALYDFYLAYEDHFVTDYAATNPGEDMAESWTFFVLRPKPNGDTIAEQKILFFYGYPELVSLREAILPNVYALSR